LEVQANGGVTNRHLAWAGISQAGFLEFYHLRLTGLMHTCY
jgi:hypothetical protein